MTLVRVLLIAALLGACATPYQPMAFNGGYESHRIGYGRHFIRVEVNQGSSRAYSYFLRRASYLCRGSYRIEDRQSGGGGFTDTERTHVEGVVQCTVPRRATKVRR